MLLGLINISVFGIFMYVMSWYSRDSVMFSVFALQSRGCGFETRLVHMPVMLVTNVHPGVIIKPNRP